MPTIVKVAWGNPTEGHTPPEALQSIALMAHFHGKLEAESKNKDVQFQFYRVTAGRMFTPMAREKMAEAALDAGMDYLFMVDDDMLCPPDTFTRLYYHQADVVAPLAFTRNYPYLAVLYSTREGYDPSEGRSYVMTDWIRNWPRNKLVECDAVGFGAVLIKTSLFKKMKRPWFMCSSGTGEDIWFCARAKEECNARIFMDTTFEIGHIGAPIIVDSKLHEEANKPDYVDKMYGAYKKYGVYDVSHFPRLNGNHDPEVLAR